MATKVLVTNISEQATEKTLRDFFTFCGEIASLTLGADPVNAGTQQATVEFTEASSTQTALLLTNAMIVDRPITVVPLGAGSGEEYTPAEGEPTKTSVLAQMFAAGYMLGDDAKAKARAYDEKFNLSLKIKVGTELAKVKINEMDQKYGVSEKAGKATEAVKVKAKEVDAKYGISEKAGHAKQQVTHAAGQAKSAAMQNSTVQTAVATMDAVKELIGQKVDALKLETQSRIEEKKRERAASGGPAAVTDAPPATEQAAAPAPAAPAPAPAAPAAQK